MSDAVQDQGVVHEVSDCLLQARLDSQMSWSFAAHHRTEIDAFWQEETTKNPSYFNGTVFMMLQGAIAQGVFQGDLIPVEFKAFCYWRAKVQDDQSARDCFGSAVVITSDGALMLARQSAGNINAGLTYLPGGFIDQRDVSHDCQIGIRESVLRELAEETGLVQETFKVRSNYLITQIGRQVSIGVVIDVKLTSDELNEQIRAFLASEEQPELEEIVFIEQPQDLALYDVPAYTQCIVRHLLR